MSFISFILFWGKQVVENQSGYVNGDYNYVKFIIKQVSTENQ